MRKLSWDEIKQIETEVYNEGYSGVRVRRGVNIEDARSNGQTTPQGARIAGYDRYNNDVNSRISEIILPKQKQDGQQFC